MASPSLKETVLDANNLRCRPFVSLLLLVLIEHGKECEASSLSFRFSFLPSETLSLSLFILFSTYNFDMLLFHSGKRYLHTGDMRFSPRFLSYPHLNREKHGVIHTVFLDTTYCHPKHAFPTQDKTIEMVLEEIKHWREQHGKGKVLFLVGAYNIGKERILWAIAKAFGVKFYADRRKRTLILPCVLSAEGVSRYITDDPFSTNFHITRMSTCGTIWPYFQPNFESMQSYLENLPEVGSEKSTDAAAPTPKEVQFQESGGVRHPAMQTSGAGEPKSVGEGGKPAEAVQAKEAARTTISAFTHVVGILPTGWADASSYNKRNALRVRGNLV